MKHLKPSWKLHSLRIQQKKRREEQRVATRRAKNERDRNARRASNLKALSWAEHEHRRRSHH